MSDNLAHKLNNVNNKESITSTLAKPNIPIKKPANDFNKNENLSQEAELNKQKLQSYQQQNLNQSSVDKNKQIQKDKVDSNSSKGGELGPKYEKENLKIPENKSTKKSDENSQTKNNQKPEDNTSKSTAQKLNQAKNIASKALSGDIIGAGEDVVGASAQVGTQWLLTTLWGAVWFDWTLLTLAGLNVFLVFSLLLPDKVCQFGDDYLIGKWIPSRDLAKWTEIIILMIIDAIILMIISLTIFFVYKFATCGTWDLFNVWLSNDLPGSESALSEAQKRCFQ